MQDAPSSPQLLQVLFQDLLRYQPDAINTLGSLAKGYVRFVGFRAVVLYRLSRALKSRGVAVVPRLLSNWMISATGAEVLSGAEIGPGLLLTHPVGVVIGNGARIGSHCTFMQGVTVGETLANGLHEYPRIGDNVTIGAHAALLGPIHVGHGSLVGANSVVVKDVAAGSVVAGIPARRIRGTAERQACEMKAGSGR